MEYNYREIYYLGTNVVNPNMVYRLPDNVTIPNDPENTDWQQYQVWLSEGGVPLPPDA